MIRATKRASLDRDQTLSDFTADALRAQLREPPARQEPQPGDLTPLYAQIGKTEPEAPR